jgi:tetratricopeptide (TPR) repeat protein
MKTIIIIILVLFCNICSAQDDYKKAQSYLDNGSYQEAINLYSILIEKNSKDISALYGRGIAYKNIENYELALEDFYKIQLIDTTHYLSIYEAGNCHDKMGSNYIATLIWYNSCLKMKPEFASAYYSRGMVFYKNGAFSDAIDDFEIAISIDPSYKNELIPLITRLRIKLNTLIDQKNSVKYSTYIQDIGWTKEETNGSISGTIEKSKRIEAIKINTTIPNITISYNTHFQDKGWIGWSDNNSISGFPKMGLRLEAISIKLNENPYYSVEYKAYVQNVGWMAWVKEGEIAGTVGKKQRLEAIQIRLFKKDDENKKAENYSYNNDYDKAIKTYTKLIENNSIDIEALWGRGVSYLKLNKYERAANDFLGIINADSTNNKPYSLLGFCLDNLGYFEDAIKCYNKCLEITPDYAQAFYGRGMTYQKHKYYKMAIEDYEMAISLEPSYKDMLEPLIKEIKNK